MYQLLFTISWAFIVILGVTCTYFITKQELSFLQFVKKHKVLLVTNILLLGLFTTFYMGTQLYAFNKKIDADKQRDSIETTISNMSTKLDNILSNEIEDLKKHNAQQDTCITALNEYIMQLSKEVYGKHNVSLLKLNNHIELLNTQTGVSVNELEHSVNMK